MSVAIITPTRRRWHWLARQAAALAPQLSPDDRWIIAVDNDEPDPRYTDRIRELVGDRLITWLHLCYERPDPPHGVVNRLRNAAVAFADPEADVVELDDDDIMRPDALAEIRHGFEAGYDFIFGWHKTCAMIEDPRGDVLLEPWPDYRPHYEPGDFGRGKVQPCGVRAIRRSLWNRLGGWNPEVWPNGNIDFAVRAERSGAQILCVEKLMCEVCVNLDGVSTRYRRPWLSSSSHA